MDFQALKDRESELLKIAEASWQAHNLNLGRLQEVQLILRGLSAIPGPVGEVATLANGIAEAVGSIVSPTDTSSLDNPVTETTVR